MKAVNNYKDMIEELGRVLWVFAIAANEPSYFKTLGWTIEEIDKIQGKVQASLNMADLIKDELIGDGKESEFSGRLKMAFFELDRESAFVPSYFPKFDESLFVPDTRSDLFKAIEEVYGDDTFILMTKLHSICEFANHIVQCVSGMLDDVCSFVGYNPELQQETDNSLQEQQPGTQQIPTINDTDKERLVFGNALQKQYMTLRNGVYNWTKSKSLLAYMCGRLYCGDRIKEDESDYSKEYIKGSTQMPAKEVKALFGVDVASNRYSIKTPPRNSWKVDELFKSNGASK